MFAGLGPFAKKRTLTTTTIMRGCKFILLYLAIKITDSHAAGPDLFQNRFRKGPKDARLSQSPPDAVAASPSLPQSRLSAEPSVKSPTRANPSDPSHKPNWHVPIAAFLGRIDPSTVINLALVLTLVREVRMILTSSAVGLGKGGDIGAIPEVGDLGSEKSELDKPLGRAGSEALVQRLAPPDTEAQAIAEARGELSDRRLSLRVWRAIVRTLPPPHIAFLLSTIPSRDFLPPLAAQRSLLDNLKETLLPAPSAFSSLLPPRSVLLHGPPGCGKTLITRHLAHLLMLSNNPCLVLSPSSFLSKYVGETSKNVDIAFESARVLALFSQLYSTVRPVARDTAVCLLIDEADALLHSRISDSITEGPGSRDLRTDLMRQLDGIRSSRGIVVVASTNRPWDVDEALLRRLPVKKLIKRPSQFAREEILKSLLSGVVDRSFNFRATASNLAGVTGSDIKEIASRSAARAAKEGRQSISTMDVERVGREFMREMDGLGTEKSQQNVMGGANFMSNPNGGWLNGSQNEWGHDSVEELDEGDDEDYDDDDDDDDENWDFEDEDETDHLTLSDQEQDAQDGGDTSV